MNKQEVAVQVEELVRPWLTGQGLALIEVEVARSGKKTVLRLFIDKPGGVSLDDCAEVSQVVGEILEVHDVIPQSYVLEVSSPGLTRVLKKLEEYQYFAGRLVRITVRSKTGPPDSYRGKLLGLEGDTVLVAQGDEVLHIPAADIIQARLDLEL